LENRRSEDDKMSRRIWEAAETKAGKTGVTKAERRREEKGRRKSQKRLRQWM